MMSKKQVHQFLNYAIAFIWIANGLFCKVLNRVPRHEQIVARILGAAYAPVLTKVIGSLEILMCLWILSGFRSRYCAIIQMMVIATMNIIEFFLARDLLLFGGGNIILAFVLIAVIYYNEFILNRPVSA